MQNKTPSKDKTKIEIKIKILRFDRVYINGSHGHHNIFLVKYQNKYYVLDGWNLQINEEKSLFDQVHNNEYRASIYHFDISNLNEAEDFFAEILEGTEFSEGIN